MKRRRWTRWNQIEQNFQTYADDQPVDLFDHESITRSDEIN